LSHFAVGRRPPGPLRPAAHPRHPAHPQRHPPQRRWHRAGRARRHPCPFTSRSPPSSPSSRPGAPTA